MRTVAVPGARAPRLPALGLGTWRYGENQRQRAQETAAVTLALQLGYRLIDTAEMYGEGGAEEVIGAALAQAFAAGTLQRDELRIVSKVYPHNASRRGALQACARSLRRLGLTHIDVYLLHWRGEHPLQETVASFEQLREEGKIGCWGVSNFDVSDLEELFQIQHGDRCALNQVYYSASCRGPEFALLPWQRRHRLPLMAYSPIDQGALGQNKMLQSIAARHGASAAQIALAWVLRHEDVIAIPKAVRTEHLRENWAAAKLVLSAEDLAQIDALFAPPRRRSGLRMI